MSQCKKTKADFVEAILQKSEKSGDVIPKETIKYVVDAMLDEMKTSLTDGCTIELRGFGVFEFRYRKGKSNARNPRTGMKVSVPGHSVVAFRAGHEIKDIVWNKEYGKKEEETLVGETSDQSALNND